MPLDVSDDVAHKLAQMERKLEELRKEENKLLDEIRAIRQQYWGVPSNIDKNTSFDPMQFKMILENHEKRISKLEQDQIPESSHVSTVNRLVAVMLEKKKFRSIRQWAKSARVVPKTIYKNMGLIKRKLLQQGWKLLNEKIDNGNMFWIE